MTSKPPQFSHAVRHLGLWYSYRMGLPNEVKQLLRLCKEVVDLHFGNLWDPGLHPILTELPLQRQFVYLNSEGPVRLLI
jgi:hypothetical protein